MDQSLELTPKQARFCAEYFVDLNATQAALRAGYSRATAENGKLMASPNIRRALQQRSAELNAEHELARHRIFTELEKMAFASMGDYFDDSGKPKPLNLVGADAKAALGSYHLTETDKGSSVRIRLNNKLAALEKMARHIGFYGFALGNKDVGGQMAEARAGHVVGDNTNNGGTDKYHPADGSPVKYEGDDEEHEADVRRWIAEAREQAIYETEQRMRAEFAALEQGTKNKEQGREAVGAGNGGAVGVKNTDIYPPAGGEQGAKNKEQGQGVVGPDSYRANTNNGGPVKKKRTYTMITAKYTAKRHFDYVKIR